MLKIGTYGDDKNQEEKDEEVKSYLKHNFALVISGDSLTYILPDDILEKKLIRITDLCKVIVGARFAGL